MTESNRRQGLDIIDEHNTSAVRLTITGRDDLDGDMTISKIMFNISKFN